MGFKTFADSQGDVTYNASDLGAFLNAFSGGDFIVQNIGDEMEISYLDSSLSISCGSGRAIIGGRGVIAYEDNALELEASASDIFICLEVDLSQTTGNETQLVQRTSAQLVYQNLNNGVGQKRDFVLGKASTDANGVTDFVDMRTIKEFTSGFVVTKDEDGDPLAEPITFEIVLKKEST